MQDRALRGYLCPSMGPFITESRCFLPHVLVARKMAGDIAIGNAETIEIIVELEQPSLDVEMFDNELCQ